MSKPLELYGAPFGNSLRASIALEEARIDYRPISLDLYSGEHKAATYLQMNPDGQVPTLVDHSTTPSFVLTQSNAIMLYVADMKPDTLMPDGGPAQAIAMERLFYFVTEVISPNFSSFLLKRWGSDLEAQQLLKTRALTKLKDAERFIANSSYMAGETFTLADISAFTTTRSFVEDIDWNNHRALASWYKRIESRPAVVRGLKAFNLNPTIKE